MTNTWKIAIVVALVAAVAATFAMRSSKRAGNPASAPPPAVRVPPAPAPAAATGPACSAATPAPQTALARSKPRILELGSMRCQACLDMAKVLDALRASQGAKLQVDFIDVFEQPEAGDRYKISLIPTQILYDGAGKEIFRHQGFFSHDDVLAKFRALGVKL